jgi:hypothetical protein
MLKVIVILLSVGVIYVGYDQLVALYYGDVSGKEAITEIRERVTDKNSASSDTLNSTHNNARSSSEVGGEGDMQGSGKSNRHSNEAERMAERLLGK